MEVGIAVEGSDCCPELQYNESIALKQPKIHLHLNDHDLGEGQLFLGTKRLYWISSYNPKTLNFAIDYVTIGLHALCQDLESWPVPCLYCQLDVDLDLHSYISERLTQALGRPINTTQDCSPLSASDVADDELVLTELRFAPSDQSCLSTIFNKFTEMSSLNADNETSNNGNPTQVLNNGEWITADGVDEWDPDDDDDDYDD